MSSALKLLIDHQENKKDKKTVGLVVQGGGMRAVYSGAVLATLIEHGLVNSFDHIVGSSAGAMNGAYFMSMQKHAVEVYTEGLTNKKFVNFYRAEKKVDIDYLIDHVLKLDHPFDLEKFKSAHPKLHVVVTNAKSGRSEVISKHEDLAKIYEEFRATTALPLLYDKPVNIDDKWFIDGGVSDLIPIDVAYRLGCTDIFVIMTQTMASYSFSKRHTRLVNHLMRRFAKKYPESVRKIIPTNEAVLKLNLRKILKPWSNVRVYLLEPSDEEILISTATTDKEKVRRLAELGVKDAEAFLKSNT